VDVEVERLERLRLHVEPKKEGEASIEEEQDDTSYVCPLTLPPYS